MGHKQREQRTDVGNWGNKPVIEIRQVPNPCLTDELIDAIDKGEVSVPKHIGAAINLSSLIGALARIKGRTKAQTEAAVHYRHSWESGMIGGARAIDYASPRVDTSRKAVSVLLDYGMADRFDYSRAVRRVGMLNARLIELVVCEGRSIREVAVMLGHGDSRAKREALRKRLLASLDMLDAEFGGGGRRRVRHDGDRPTDTSTDVVIERRKATTEA